MYIRPKLTFRTLVATTWWIHALLIPVVVITTFLYLEWLGSYVKVSATVVSVLGTALAFFIGFTNAHAYERWWEARKAWGVMLNASRSWGRMVMTFLSPASAAEPEQDRVRQIQRGMVYRHLAFVCAARGKLRDESDQEYRKYLTDEEIQQAEGQADVPIAILMLQGKAIDQAERQQHIDVIRMAQMNETLNHLIHDALGPSERIKSTVFPPGYANLTRVLMWAFIVLLPLTLSDATGYWAILYSYLLGFLFTGTFTAGQHLLNPFDDAKFGTPVSALTRRIEIMLLEQLGEQDIPAPIEPVNGEYLL